MKKFGLFLLVLVLMGSETGFAKSKQPRLDEGVKSDTPARSAYGAENKRFGIGAYLGEPFGLTAKAYITSQFGVDLIGGWSFDEEGFTVIADAFYDFYSFKIGSTSVTLPIYVGAGGKFVFDADIKGQEKDTAGIRFPIGIAVQWTNQPFELFLEIAPGVRFTSDTKFDLTGAIGARIYF